MEAFAHTFYPFDFNRYHRGDLVPNEVLEKAYPGLEEKHLRLKKMSVASEMERFFEDERADTVCVQVKEAGILILTHQEQFEYTEKRQRVNLRSWVKMHRKDLGNDPTKLSEEQREHREKRLRRNSWLLQQQLKAPRVEFPKLDAPEEEEDEIT